MDERDLLIDLTPRQKVKEKEYSHKLSESGRFSVNAPEDEEYIVDFCFSPSEEWSDLRNLSVFFLSAQGEVFFYCPIIFEGIRIPKESLEGLKHELFSKFESEPRQYESSKAYYEFLFEYFLKYCDSGKSKYIVTKSIYGTKYESLAENSIQG